MLKVNEYSNLDLRAIGMTSAMQATKNLNTVQIINEFSASMRRHLREHTDGTNVNRDSLLATDYLNHYSGMVMLLEQVPETHEELILYLLSWQPISYKEHFKRSGFRDGDLAVRAYEHAPESIRATFDQVIERLQNESLNALEQVRKQAEEGNTKAIFRTCEESVPVLRELIAEASAIVNQQKSSSNVIEHLF
jgi:hypothetical protein